MQTKVASFSFNPFQENTYILYDDSKECIIFDPGCYSQTERDELTRFVEMEGLSPVCLINTHCHIDHVLGNKFVKEHYGIPLRLHEIEKQLLDAAPAYGLMYGIEMETSPDPDSFIAEGEEIRFGNTVLNSLFTPGHSPGSLSFYCKESGFIIAGDVLFKESIGRTDLPGGDYDTLIASINRELMALPDETIVYSGHGPSTTVGDERTTNPFLINA